MQKSLHMSTSNALGEGDRKCTTKYTSMKTTSIPGSHFLWGRNIEVAKFCLKKGKKKVFGKMPNRKIQKPS